MRNPFAIIYKLVKKGFALVLLSLLTTFSYVYNIVFFFYRLIAVGFAAVGTVMVGFDVYKYGFTGERGLILLFLMGMVAVRYLMPLLIPVMQRWIEDLTDYIYEPLFVRSPVRYTI